MSYVSNLESSGVTSGNFMNPMLTAIGQNMSLSVTLEGIKQKLAFLGYNYDGKQPFLAWIEVQKKTATGTALSLLDALALQVVQAIF